MRRLPDLRFRLRDRGREYVCTMESDGELEALPSEGVGSLRERLVRLHVQHGDPGLRRRARSLGLDRRRAGDRDDRWAGTGLVMWWPMRATRLYGTLALAAGVTALALSLWRAMGLAQRAQPASEATGYASRMPENRW